MKSFTHVSSIPIKSDSNVILNDNNIYFSSHNNFYNPSHLISVNEPILSFSISSHIFLLTENMLYQVNRNGKIITEMKMIKKSELIKSNENYIIIFKYNSFDIFYIPKKFSIVMYKLKNRIVINSKVKTCYFYNDYIICSFFDNSVRIYNIENGNEELLGSFLERIIECFMNKDKIIIICENTIILFDYKLSNDENKIFEETTMIKKINLEKIKNCCYDLKTDIYFIAQENDNGKHSIVMFQNNQINTTITDEFDEIKNIFAENNIIAIKTENQIFSYDYKNLAIQNVHHLSNIHCFNYFQNLFFLGCDNSIKIYKEDKFLRNYDLDVKSKIIFIHGARNIILTISSLGTIRLYDSQNFYCFKTFDIPFNIQCSDVNEDISLIFLANTSIFIYDMKRGKCIDELKGHSGPIIKIRNKGNYLFSLGMDNKIRKQNIFDTKKEGKELENNEERMIIDFAISKNLYVLNNKELIIYDTNFNFLNIVSLKTKSNVNYEKFCIQDDKFAFIYGKIKHYKDDKYKNYIFIYNIEHGYKIQEIEVEKTIKMEIVNDNLIIQTENNFNIYNQNKINFEPIDLEIECDEAYAYKLLQENNTYAALLCTLKLNEFILIKNIISKIPKENIQEIVKHLPKKYIPSLRDHLNKIRDFEIEWIKNIIFYHTNVGKQLEINDETKEAMQYAKMNYLILLNLAKRNK